MNPGCKIEPIHSPAEANLPEEDVIYKTLLVVSPEGEVGDETAEQRGVIDLQFQGELKSIFFRLVQVKIFQGKGHWSRRCEVEGKIDI